MTCAQPITALKDAKTICIKDSFKVAYEPREKSSKLRTHPILHRTVRCFTCCFTSGNHRHVTYARPITASKVPKNICIKDFPNVPYDSEEKF